MDLQNNAAEHIGLRHRDFKKLCLANFLFALYVYMLLPVLPLWMTEMTELSRFQMSSVMAAFGVGVFSLGAFSSYLIQRYRRNKVCILFMFLLLACGLTFAYLEQEYFLSATTEETFLFMLLVRFFAGAFFGLAYMILNSTLIVDCCESSHRTRANMVSMWSYRWAVVLGPMVGLFVFRESGYLNTLYVSAALCFVAMGVLASVQFPFKAPDDNVRLFSFDRFFMPRSFPLFVASTAVSASLGVVFASLTDYSFFAALAAGFLVLMLLQRFVPQIRQMGWITSVSYVLVLAGLVAVFSSSRALNVSGALVLGLGLSAMTSRLHIFFIHVGDHCQRGTSQSTYILSFELGMALGFAARIYFSGVFDPMLLSLVFAEFSMLVYFCIAFTWLKRNLRK